jgi:hypothetical protein
MPRLDDGATLADQESYPELPEYADASQESDVSEGLVGLSAAGGREQYVGAQMNQAARAAAGHPSTPFDGDLYRAVPTGRYQTYADHSWSAAGRYNATGQSALYTAPTLDDLRAETANYSGLDDNSVMRSRFSGELLDLRSLNGVTQGALNEPHGERGSHRTQLARLTGEDAYTIPRAVADEARARGLSGVIAPANSGNANVALFPDAPGSAGPGRLHDGLRYVSQQEFAGGGSSAPHTATDVASPIVDSTPNRNSPAGGGVDTYTNKVTADADAHSRAGGARYGAAGAGVVTLVEGALTGHVDPSQLGINMTAGAALGHADTVLSRSIDGLIRPPAVPSNVAGAASASKSAIATGAASRPVGLSAGTLSGGAIGGIVSGGMSVWNQADAVRAQSVDAGQATANVAVDTGVGIATGAAGAAAGAAIGSVIPVAGTAVGAVVGFGIGMGAGWLAQNSGIITDAKQGLGELLTENFEAPLDAAWDVAGAGVDAVKSAAGTVADAASTVAGGIADGTSAAAGAIGDGLSSAWNFLTD